MKLRIIFLLVILVALAAALPMALRLDPSAHKPKPAPKTPLEDLPLFAPARGNVDHYEPVTVTIEMPPASEFPPPVGQGAACPQKQLGHVLGAAVTPGKGCIVVNLVPDGVAAKAGIQLGDRLGDSADACPSSLAPKFIPREEAYKLEWTVYRPVLIAQPNAAGQGPAKSAS